MVDVRLLGPVMVADGAAPLGGAKQRGLFALLAGHIPPHRSDDQIVLGLWGEDPPASARNAVQVYATGLRKALRPLGVDLVRAGQGYTLVGEPLTVDLVEFETAVAQGRGALHGGDAERAAVLLEGALRLWLGAPFEGATDLPFAEAWGGLLGGVRQTALADLASAQMRLGRHGDAITTAQALVADHPYDERGWAALATAQYWVGRQSDALETCRRARDLLADELGVEPGAELSELTTRILRQELVDPAVGVEAKQVEPGLQPPPLPPRPDPFVGREQEVRTVVDLLGVGRRVVTLVGMGGIGKTTLALAVAHRLAESGRSVVISELESETTSDSAMERICRDLGVDPGHDPAAAIGRATVDVVVLDNVEQVADLAPALDDVVRHHAGPTFLVTSRAAVGVRGEQNVPVPPLTVDPDEVGSSPAAELFWAVAARVRPDLDPARDREEVRALCDLLGGIPLAIELVAGRMRTQTPALLLGRAADGRTSLLDTRSAAPVPERQATLRTVLADAVETLSGPGRVLLLHAGCLDGWVRQETLEFLAGDALRGDFLDALDDLVGHGLAAVDGEGRVRALPPVRGFVREQPGSADSGAALLLRYVDLAEVLGPQLYGSDAGQVMAGLTADADVVTTVLNGALRAGAGPSEVTAATRLLIALRRYWLLSSRIPEARRAIEALRDSGAPSETDRARLSILGGTLAQWIGVAEAEHLLRDALDEATRLGAPNDRLLVSGWCSLAAQAATYDDPGTARLALARAQVTAGESHDHSLVELVQDLEGYVAHQLGDHEVALAATLEGLGRARRRGDEWDIVSLLSSAAELLSELGRDEEALAMSEEVFQRSAGRDLGYAAAITLLIGGAVQVAAGRVAAARGSVLAALQQLQEQPDAQKPVSDALHVMAACEAAAGHDEECARLVAAARAIRIGLGLAPDALTTSRTGRLTLPARERLGEEGWRMHSARGAADPLGEVDRLLGERGQLSDERPTAGAS